jgi:hypothetical protein
MSRHDRREAGWHRETGHGGGSDQSWLFEDGYDIRLRDLNVQHSKSAAQSLPALEIIGEQDVASKQIQPRHNV